jgi:hypothetical protein
MDDRELNQLLREWEAPDAPPHLGPPVRATVVKRRWWTWLLTGSIRVPVPIGVAAALIAAFWLFSEDAPREPVAEPPSTSQPVVSLADFQPVETVELRVVGEVR